MIELNNKQGAYKITGRSPEEFPEDSVNKVLDKLKLNCACIGGYAKTPLGIISFIENLLMAIMSILILFN